MEEGTSLTDLPLDCLTSILCYLPAQDLFACARSCKHLHTCTEEACALLCQGWGNKTSPQHWLSTSRLHHGPATPSRPHDHSGAMHAPIPNYRSLYRTLLRADDLVGWYWAGAGGMRGTTDAKGSLYRVEWAHDCIIALQLKGHTQSTELSVVPLFSLGPAWSLNLAHALDDTHLVVRCYAPPKAAPAAAEAAVGAAMSGSPASKSFAAEMLRFMSGQVQGSRGATRRSQKRASSLSASSRSPTPPAQAMTMPVSANEHQGMSPPMPSVPGSAPQAAGMYGGSPQAAWIGGGGSLQNAPYAHTAGSSPSTSVGQLTPAGLSQEWSSPPHSPGLEAGSSSNRSSALTQQLHAMHLNGPESRVQSVPSAGRAHAHHYVDPTTSGPAIATHHFYRLRPLVPTRSHPLVGLWKGLYGVHGLEIIEITTDFARASARTVAHKVLGDSNIPAGKLSWWANSSAMTPEQAASDSEVQLTESRRWLTGTPTQWMDEEEEAELPMIVKVFKGQGHIAGHNFRDPQLVEGRLWQYEESDGQQSFAFLWMSPGTQNPLAIINYNRVLQ